MKLKLAGGCGEHGRNCFYVELDEYAFLVDCGIMADEKNDGFPHLNKEEILNIKYVFLTHSHLDHTGAIYWLIDNGFNGYVIASKETLNQISLSYSNTICLEELFIDDLKVEYGRSGHCIGSVWYLFEYKGKRIFFSGDYSEDTLCFQTDKIRDIKADIAVIDSAYGYDEIKYQEYCNDIVIKTKELLKQYSHLLFPVPKYGRGLELYALLKRNIPELTYAGDAHFVEQLSLLDNHKHWLKEDSFNDLSLVEQYNKDTKAQIIFISNPQLKTESSQKIVKEMIKDSFAIMSGTVEKDTLSYELLKQEKMIMCRYPVHMNYKQYLDLISYNHFDTVIAYHSPMIKPDSYIYEIK